MGRSKAVEWKTSRNGGCDEAALGSASMASLGSTTTSGTEAVVFSIQFYGKTIGEVGLLDQDLSELDWTKFKSYIFQNLLSVNHQENICVSYSDDEGDKLPIESEEEYREALKVAKKKAEAHDKLVLDITRQGSLPTVFSIVSSGIKRVSSSPPKEGGISFFKTASPPKESTSFGGRSNGQDKRSFPSLFSTDRGDGEVSGGGTRPKESGSLDQPPKWFTTYMNKFREDLCEDVVTKLAHLIREELAIAPKDDQEKPQECSEGKGNESPLALVASRTPRVKSDLLDHSQPFEFPQAEFKLRTLNSKPKFTCKSLIRAEGDAQQDSSPPTQLKVTCPPAYNNFLAESGHLKNDSAAPLELYVARKNQRISSHLQKRSSFQLKKGCLKERRSGMEKCAKKKEENAKDNIEMRGIELQFNNPQKKSSFQITFTEGKESSDEKIQDLESHFKNKNGDAKENMKGSDGGVKRKKSGKDEDKVTKWLERMEEKMAKKQGKMEERFSKKHEKLEERLMKKQEKLTERLKKQQEKAEKRKSTSNCSRLLEIEKSSRTQGKVLAKMEGLRKKQACTPEELSKLRKVVDKHHRAADKHGDGTLAEQRYLRRSDRKAGKSRKIDIDRKAYPVDASLLHKALLELEALAEDSPTESHKSAILGYNAFYVKDITYPDGSQVPPGAQFVKTWRVLNSGVMPWNEKTEVCKWTQVQFQGSPVDWKLKPLEKKVVCPPLKPGECGNISITFIAPDEPGWYATHWRFCQQGRVFGNQIWCAVYVTSNANSDTESQTKVAVDKSDSDGALGAEGTSTEEENEEKECEEQSSSDEQSSEEDVPNFMDAAKDVHDTENATAEGSANATSDDIPDLEAEPDSNEGEASQQSEYEVGIIENYYDAEDSTEEDTQKCVDTSDQESANDLEATAEPNKDLISFEEEAELIPSGSALNEAHSDSVVVHSVMPLKDMARESVDTLNFLKDSVVVQNEDKSQDPVEGDALDELSFSSGSFSDLDSEDQAILNESDTDISDQDYFVVTMPECFDLTLPYSSVAESSQQNAPHGITNSIPEAERPDSPDFLTADEDDRATTAANKKYQEESATRTRSTADDNEASSHSGSVLENARTTDAEERHQGTQGSRSSGNSMPSLPLPPTETRGFMDIPPEALRTNLAINLYKENSTRPDAEQQLKHQESGRANWGLGAEERQEVVCEQPVSAQMKTGASPQSQSKPSPSAGGMPESNTSQGAAVGNTPEQASVDGAAAALPDERASIIPDELVSIIPEDLVRGVWNTARTFITLINQEMHSPSANGPASIGDGEGAAASPTPPCPTQEPPQKEERRKESPQAATPEAGEEPPSLPPPLQQLADMGFSNHEMNQCLLTKYNNDVACAVAELIVLNCQ